MQRVVRIVGGDYIRMFDHSFNNHGCAVVIIVG